MSGDEVLSKEEIDTLLAGAEDVAGSPGGGRSSEVEPYDLFNPAGTKPAPLPRLESLTEKTVTSLGQNLGRELNVTLELEHQGLKPYPYAEFLASVAPPVLLSVVELSPLSGQTLIVMDAKCLVACVDALFGGIGRPAGMGERSFGAAEKRFAKRLADIAATSLVSAWSSVVELEVVESRALSDLGQAAVCSARDHVYVTTIPVPLEGTEPGDMHIVIPDASLDPVRESLGAGDRAAQVENPNWETALHESSGGAVVEVAGRIRAGQLTLREVMGLAAGDFIPIDKPDALTLYAGDLAVLHGTLGTQAGRHAVRVTVAPISDDTTVH